MKKPKVYQKVDELKVERKANIVQIEFPGEKNRVWAMRPSTAVTLASNLERRDPVGKHEVNGLEMNVKQLKDVDYFVIRFGFWKVHFELRTSRDGMLELARNLRRAASGRPGWPASEGVTEPR